MQLPRQLRLLFSDDNDKEECDEGEGEGITTEREVEMRWDICKYLPEAASCQDLFRVSNLVSG